DAEAAAGAVEAGLDLVGDQEYPALPAVGGDPLNERGRRHHEAALALDRFQDRRGQAVRADLLDQAPERLQAGGHRFRLRREARAVEVGEGAPVDVRRQRSEVAIARPTGEGEREQRPAVEGILERDHAGPAGGVAGDLHRLLDGLGARVDEHHLLGDAARRDRAEALGEADVGLVREHVEGRVEHALRLRPDGRHHFGVVGARVESADAAREIDVAVAIDVDQGGAPGRGDEDGVLLVDAAGNVLLAEPCELSRPRAWHLGHVGDHPIPVYARPERSRAYHGELEGAPLAPMPPAMRPMPFPGWSQVHRLRGSRNATSRFDPRARSNVPSPNTWQERALLDLPRARRAERAKRRLSSNPCLVTVTFSPRFSPVSTKLGLETVDVTQTRRTTVPSKQPQTLESRGFKSGAPVWTAQYLAFRLRSRESQRKPADIGVPELGRAASPTWPQRGSRSS